jgi:hypothetical protein
MRYFDMLQLCGINTFPPPNIRTIEGFFKIEMSEAGTEFGNIIIYTFVPIQIYGVLYHCDLYYDTFHSHTMYKTQDVCDGSFTHS